MADFLHAFRIAPMQHDASQIRRPRCAEGRCSISCVWRYG